MNPLKLSLCAGLTVVLFTVIVPRLEAAPGRAIASAARPTQETTASWTVSGSPATSSQVAPAHAPGTKPPTPTHPQIEQAPASSQPVQLRGLWADAFGPGFKTPAQVDRLVRDAVAMRVNVIFMQVGRRGDCYCNKAAMPRSADPELAPGFDPLAYLLERAHRVGIQVHAWIITTAVWNVHYAVGAKDHVFLTHSARTLGRDNWLTERLDGTRQANVDYMLDPGHPDAAEYIVQMYLSVIRNYDVDGIQLDRVRYPDSSGPNFLPVWGYNPTALARFRAETNRPGDLPARPDPTDPLWTQWRRNQITDLVRRVYLEAKRLKPSLWVSAATITYKEPPQTLDAFTRTRTYFEVLQDWPGWMQEGILDVNIPMNYKRERDNGASFDGWNRFAALTRGSGRVAVGAGLYLNTPEDNLRQLKRSTAVEGVTGWVGYSYRTPDVHVLGARRSSADGVRVLTGKLKAQGAPFEASARWGTAPTSNLRGLLGRVLRDGQPISGLPIELLTPNGEVRLVQSDANGYFGATMLPAGFITVRVQDRPEPSLSLEIGNGQITLAPDLTLP